jgi:cytochrome P450
MLELSQSFRNFGVGLVSILPPPDSPLKAVTHPNPYPYYAQLVAEQPFYFDPGLRLWVASSAEAVTAALHHPFSRVRPIDEPIPTLLQDSAAGIIFRALVRMNDGAYHAALKPDIARAVSAFSREQVDALSAQWANTLLDSADSSGNPLLGAALTDFAFRLPVYVVGGLLGLADEQLASMCAWIDDFARCIAPGGLPDHLARGNAAAEALLTLFQSAFEGYQRAAAVMALAQHRSGASEAGPHLAIANAIGLLSQTYEATAGLIGNTLLALVSNADAFSTVTANPALLPQCIHEVARYDAPVQNTRRFMAEDGVIAGRIVERGEAILLVLAAANRDAKVNAQPSQFDLFRPRRVLFTFSSGHHACPGDAVAISIATAGVGALLSRDTDLAALNRAPHYRASLNTRIPLFS